MHRLGHRLPPTLIQQPLSLRAGAERTAHHMSNLLAGPLDYLHQERRTEQPGDFHRFLPDRPDRFAGHCQRQPPEPFPCASLHRTEQDRLPPPPPSSPAADRSRAATAPPVDRRPRPFDSGRFAGRAWSSPGSSIFAGRSGRELRHALPRRRPANRPPRFAWNRTGAQTSVTADGSIRAWAKCSRIGVNNWARRGKRSSTTMAM